MRPPKILTRRKLLLGSVGVGSAAATGLAYAKWIEPNWLRVARVDVHIPGWPEELAGFRIGQISDLHCDSAVDAHRTGRAAHLLMVEKPDVVFVTGDYLSRHPVLPKVTACTNALSPLTAAPHGAYAILGNHDWWSGGTEEITRQMSAAGFRVLRNKAVKLPGHHGVWIVGLDDYFESKQNVEQALAEVPRHAIKLLLVHEPDYADIAPPGFAVQFSGHSHGGQVRIPGLPPLNLPYLGRHYYEGLRQSPNHPVYVTRGVGMVYPKVRLFCPPEVALIRIYPT